MALLAGTQISKRYGAVEVLKGVNFSMDKGEIVSIVGPSGSGKSTLLHILSTLDRADAGAVEISGKTIPGGAMRELPPAGWKRRLVNFLVDTALIGALSVAVASLAARSASLDPFSLELLLIASPLSLAYYLLTELALGRTVGKLLTGTRVYTREGLYKPSPLNLLIRSVCRTFPFGYLEALSYLTGRPVGWHDFISGTKVARTGPYDVRLPGTMSINELARFRNERIGFVFQFHHLLPEFSALENVCIPAWIQGRPKAAVRQRAEELLNMLGLSHRMDHKPSEMSGGEQQRVAVARALINNPDIVFADEPTGNLDTANARELHALFFDLRKQFNQTFLIVTHNEELARLSDRVVHMRDGRVEVAPAAGNGDSEG